MYLAENFLKRTTPWLLPVVVVGLVGCAELSERQKGTATGAAVGVVAGAALSSVTGGRAGTGALIGGAIGAVVGNLWSKRMQERQLAMEKATAGSGIEVSRTTDNQLRVNVPSDLSFAVGRADLQPSLRPVLDQFSQGLDSSVRVLIVGHTDSTGSDAINDPLSLARAKTVRDYLSSRGVSEYQMEIAGRGSREPLVDNESDASRARNRRVEIFLREPGA